MTGARWMIMGVLAVLTVFFSLQTLRTWREPLRMQKPAAAEKKAPRPAASPPGRQSKPSRSVYDVIAARSLFDQNRTEGAADTAIDQLKPAEASRQAKRITLYGVVIDGGEKMALIAKEGARRGSEDLLWVRTGEMIERLKVAAIQSDRILVQENGSHYEILLNDQRMPGRPARVVKPAGPTVVSAGGEAESTPEPEQNKNRVNPQEEKKPKSES